MYFLSHTKEGRRKKQNLRLINFIVGKPFRCPFLLMILTVMMLNAVHPHTLRNSQLSHTLKDWPDDIN